MGDYRLVALDMDGTLLNDRIEISKENEKAIHDALDAGVIVCFSTGRGCRMCCRLRRSFSSTRR
ncbi:hypothetical protein PACILC2_49320 [Paenibacillus cisolokensis]|uniref:Uncharacterized protein n=1 Tax=Paenibacillus cisolokensis TaxID=1658519 RepID=A0ABQ4NEJ8_9BACL|nr:hypothetical protein PACILC2_49320 [Paenibacillus cisolokensis]